MKVRNIPRLPLPPIFQFETKKSLSYFLETYDFIIVGAGSGGSALIHRLSEISDWKILVLEAGGEPDIITDIPVWSTLAHHTHLNWKFFTETEEGVAMGKTKLNLNI